ncbi:MAG: DUF3597 domain-containing protein [Verrucomicrobia bacterium]|nr:DUF3597 domain-containing protein [Verrucomicrobiota bacterium]
MGLLATVLGKIFGGAPPSPRPGTSPSSKPGSSPSAQPVTTTPSGQSSATTTASGGATTTASGATTPAAPIAGRASAPASVIDVAAILDGLAAKNPEKLDWKTSIVDLLKLIDVDSSHSARVTLAKELGYSGDFNDSAAMNVWLHKQVLQKIVENGGKIPQNLLH